MAEEKEYTGQQLQGINALSEVFHLMTKFPGLFTQYQDQYNQFIALVSDGSKEEFFWDMEEIYEFRNDCQSLTSFLPPQCELAVCIVTNMENLIMTKEDVIDCYSQFKNRAHVVEKKLRAAKSFIHASFNRNYFKGYRFQFENFIIMLKQSHKEKEKELYTSLRKMHLAFVKVCCRTLFDDISDRIDTSVRKIRDILQSYQSNLGNINALMDDFQRALRNLDDVLIDQYQKKVRVISDESNDEMQIKKLLSSINFNFMFMKKTATDTISQIINYMQEKTMEHLLLKESYLIDFFEAYGDVLLEGAYLWEKYHKEEMKRKEEDIQKISDNEIKRLMDKTFYRYEKIVAKMLYFRRFFETETLTSEEKLTVIVGYGAAYVDGAKNEYANLDCIKSLEEACGDLKGYSTDEFKKALNPYLLSKHLKNKSESESSGSVRQPPSIYCTKNYYHKAFFANIVRPSVIFTRAALFLEVMSVTSLGIKKQFIELYNLKNLIDKKIIENPSEKSVNDLNKVFEKKNSTLTKRNYLECMRVYFDCSNDPSLGVYFNHYKIVEKFNELDGLRKMPNFPCHLSLLLQDIEQIENIKAMVVNFNLPLTPDEIHRYQKLLKVEFVYIKASASIKKINNLFAESVGNLKREIKKCHKITEKLMRQIIVNDGHDSSNIEMKKNFISWMSSLKLLIQLQGVFSVLTCGNSSLYQVVNVYGRVEGWIDSTETSDAAVNFSDFLLNLKGVIEQVAREQAHNETANDNNTFGNFG